MFDSAILSVWAVWYEFCLEASSDLNDPIGFKVFNYQKL